MHPPSPVLPVPLPFPHTALPGSSHIQSGRWGHRRPERMKVARSDPSSLQLPHPHSLRQSTQDNLTCFLPVHTGIDNHREVHSRVHTHAHVHARAHTHTHTRRRPDAPSSLEAAETAQVTLLPSRTGTLGPVRPGQVQGDPGGGMLPFEVNSSLVAKSCKSHI